MSFNIHEQFHPRFQKMIELLPPSERAKIYARVLTVSGYNIGDENDPVTLAFIVTQQKKYDNVRAKTRNTAYTKYIPKTNRVRKYDPLPTAVN